MIYNLSERNPVPFRYACDCGRLAVIYGQAYYLLSSMLQFIFEVYKLIDLFEIMNRYSQIDDILLSV